MPTPFHKSPSGVVLCFTLTVLLVAMLPFGRAVRAEPTTVGPVLIAVPGGFELAQTQRLKKTLISAWTRSVRDGSMKTLLQVTVHDLGAASGRPSSDDDLATAATMCVRQGMSAIERRRNAFASSPVAHIKLAGLPAARASWNGALGPRKAVGVLYCVVVGKRYTVSFHTQDLGSLPSAGMLEAMRSIEAVTLVGGPG